MSSYRYECPNCGTLSNSIRCPKCGTDTDPIYGRGYSVFSHAQLGHTDNMNLIHRQAGKASERRFTGESITGFGEL